MFESNYYSLVAGLKEYALDAETKGFDAKSILDSILEQVSDSDANIISLLYSYYDCENIASIRANRSQHNLLGNFTREELEAEVLQPTHLSKGIANVILAYATPDGDQADELDMSISFERALFGAYYKECQMSSSLFLREWSAFDRNLRNISAAITARSLERAISEVTVGEGYIVEQLQHSSAADFGLRGELPYIDAVISTVNDETNLVDKEHKMDLIRWNESLELVSFDYFNVNAILSYLTKINIVARWMDLNPTKGGAMFSRLMSELDGKELINKQ